MLQYVAHTETSENTKNYTKLMPSTPMQCIQTGINDWMQYHASKKTIRIVLTKILTWPSDWIYTYKAHILIAHCCMKVTWYKKTQHWFHYSCPNYVQCSSIPLRKSNCCLHHCEGNTILSKARLINSITALTKSSVLCWLKSNPTQQNTSQTNKHSQQ